MKALVFKTPDRRCNCFLMQAKPRCLLKGQTGVVEVEVPRGICAEAYADVRPLGRITLRDRGKTFGIGIVEKIIC